MTDGPPKGSRSRWIALVAAVLLVAALAGLVLFGRGGGPLPGWLEFLGPADAGLLDPSGPEEAVLRTLRLAGYDQAAVGEGGGTVVVRLEVPEVRSPADIELTWQTALGAAATAYPDADRYVAQVFADGTALVEIRIGGDELRDALDTASPGDAVERSGDIVLLSGGGVSG